MNMNNLLGNRCIEKKCKQGVGPTKEDKLCLIPGTGEKSCLIDQTAKLANLLKKSNIAEERA